MQDILVSEEFEYMVSEFTREHCQKFVETEENTHEMWTIHKKFKEQIESYLEKVTFELLQQVRKVVPTYTQKRFIELLSTREGQVDEFIIDTLTSFDDFLDFKRQALEMKLKQMKSEEPQKYKELIEKNKDYALIQEIANALEMEGDFMHVTALEMDGDLC